MKSQYQANKLKKVIGFNNVLFKVKVLNLLYYLFDNHRAEIDIYLDYLDNSEIVIRQAIMKILREVSNDKVVFVAEHIMSSLFITSDPLIVSSMKILIGTYGRRNSQEIKDLIFKITNKLISTNDCYTQELGVSILGITKMGDERITNLFVVIIEQAISQKQLSTKNISLIISTINAITEIGFANESIISAFLKLLNYVNNEDVRVAVFQALKVVKKPPSNMMQFSPLISILATSNIESVRETSMKIIKLFGVDVALKCFPNVEKILFDQNSFCRKQALQWFSQWHNQDLGPCNRKTD